jgi:drug/metabolite transporter (DMT)-like permease
VPGPRPARLSLVPILVAVAVMVVWGGTPIATRLALDDLQPLFVACLRTVFAGLLAIPLLLGMRQGLPSSGR